MGRKELIRFWEERVDYRKGEIKYAQEARKRLLEPSVLDILIFLRDYGPESDGIIPGEICEKMNYRPPFVSRAINELEAQGFASRKLGEEDRRNMIIKLTEKGLTALRELDKVFD